VKKKYLDAFMDMAVRLGQTSEAERLKVGALLVKNGAVIACGVNGTPDGWYSNKCEDEGGMTLPEVVHAEANCLYKLWSSSETASDATLFTSHSPCVACCLLIATAGIKKVYYREQYRDNSGLDYLRSKQIEVEQL
jgi:dCMP deaminase